MEIKTKVKSLKEIWKTDKRLLDSCNPGVADASAFEIPNDGLLYSYLVKRSEMFQNPTTPNRINTSNSDRKCRKRNKRNSI